MIHGPLWTDPRQACDYAKIRYAQVTGVARTSFLILDEHDHGHDHSGFSADTHDRDVNCAREIQEVRTEHPPFFSG